MHVDEAGADHAAGSVEDPGPGAGGIDVGADLDDGAVVADDDVGDALAVLVDDPTTADHEGGISHR